jgi:GntR family transcriptional regulator
MTRSGTDQPSEAGEAPVAQPLYRQVKRLLLQRIESGEWPPGTYLPSEITLAEGYRVSVGTLRKALDELVAENVIVRRRGKGTAVTTYDADTALFRFFSIARTDGESVLPSSTVLLRRKRTATREECRDLGLPAGASVIHIQRVRDLDGKPVIFEDITLDAERFGPIQSEPKVLPNTLYDLYQRVYNAKVTGAEDRITAVALAAKVARHLDLAAGAPALRIVRIARDYRGEAIERRESIVATDSHAYVSRL